jgi:hypothetical protein
MNHVQWDGRRQICFHGDTVTAVWQKTRGRGAALADVREANLKPHFP